jgi:hypothetical protein
MFFLSVCVLFYLWRSLASVSSAVGVLWRYHISGGLGQVLSSQYVDVHTFCLRPHYLWLLVGSLILSCDLGLAAPVFLFDSCPCVPMSSSSWALFGSPLPRGLSDGAPPFLVRSWSSSLFCCGLFSIYCVSLISPVSAPRFLPPPDGYPPPLKTLSGKRRDGLLSIRG